MSVTIISKDIGDVRDKFRKECGVVKGLEDFSEEWIKRDLGVEESRYQQNI